MTRVLILSFALNLVWEIFHSALYISYQGGAITGFILFRAAIVDAIIISTLFLSAKKLNIHESMFVVIGGLVIAIGIEIWALQTGRWVYSSLMPIIPILHTGLTPTIQLAITGYIAVILESKKDSKNNT